MNKTPIEKSDKNNKKNIYNIKNLMLNEKKVYKKIKE